MNFPKIDKISPIPYHYQLEQSLREKIEDDSWKPGDRLPSEAELCSSFDVSRTVVRQALNRLSQDGLVSKEKGKGTFVTKPKLEQKLIQRTYGFYHGIEKKDPKIERKILEHELVVPPARIKNLLKLTEEQVVVKISCLRLVNRELIMFTTAYIRSDLCPALEKEDLTNRYFHQFLWDKYGVKIAYIHRTLEAVAASKYEAEILKVPQGFPLVYLENISYLEDGIPIEYFETWHRGDKCKFAIELFSAEETKERMPVHKENAVFWSGIASTEQRL